MTPLESAKALVTSGHRSNGIEDAVRFAEAVGWETREVTPPLQSDKRFWILNMGNETWRPLDWLLTGDGCMAVKAEMAKNGRCVCISSGVCIPGDAPNAFAEICNFDGTRSKPFAARTEPEAVLLAALAALKGNK